MKIIEAVEGALSLPFDEGMALERKLFLQCIDSPQRAGLIHAFFAEREVLKAPETKSASPRPLASAGIVGGGTMGAGIAVAMLDAGMPVTMIERDDTQLARGRANVEKVYDGLIKKERMTAEAKAAVMARFNGFHQLRRAGQRRHRGRGRVRGHGREEGRVRRTRPRVQARRRAGHQHLVPRHRRDRGQHLASRRTWWACTSSRRPTS
jgi:hypothetical protein